MMSGTEGMVTGFGTAGLWFALLVWAFLLVWTLVRMSEREERLVAVRTTTVEDLLRGR